MERPLGSNKRSGKGAGAHRAEPAPSAAFDDWEWVPQAEKEFEKFPELMQGNFLDLIERVLAGETRAGAGDVKHIGQGIYELRDRYKNNQFRVLWIKCGRVAVGLTCFFKNQQRTEKQDLDRAILRRKAYERDN